MPETLPAPTDFKHERHETLRERIFGEKNERPKGRHRKFGGFGIKLMMQRLRIKGHESGRHSGNPIAIEQAKPAAAQGRASVEAIPARPALPVIERRPASAPESGVVAWRERRAPAEAPNPAFVPEASNIRPEVPAAAIEAARTAKPSPAAAHEEGGRHRPEKIGFFKLRAVSELTGRDTRTDGNPDVIGTNAWFRDTYTPRHAVVEAVDAGNPNVIGSRAWHAEHANLPELDVDPYFTEPAPARPAESTVPAAPDIRPEIPVIPGNSDSLPQRTPGELYDPEDDLAFPGSRARHTALKEEYDGYTPPDPNAVDERYHEDAKAATDGGKKTDARASYFGGSNVDR